MIRLLKRDFYLSRKLALVALAFFVYALLDNIVTVGYDASFTTGIFIAGFFLLVVVIEDYRDNGLAFVHTLPFTPTEYVLSRHLFILIISTVIGALSFGLDWLFICVKKVDCDHYGVTRWSVLNSCAQTWCFMLLFYAVLLLLCSKIRMELAVVVALAIEAVIMLTLLKILGSFSYNPLGEITPFQKWYYGLSEQKIFFGSVCITIAVFLILMFITTMFMKKKEY